MNYKYFILILILFTACKEKAKQATTNNLQAKLFTLIEPKVSNITFNNKVVATYDFNFLNYAYIYNGAGVAVGDINNDGLQDVYFSANQGANKLYLNTGDFKFDDITTQANVSDNEGWTSGVSMIDINNDGWLDIYVCKAASLKSDELRRNKLYINQKDNTFKEEAKAYGLDHPGFSTQAYFFDYDNDEDLDMYLVNHRVDFRNNTKISSVIQSDISDDTSDQLFQNNGNNTFTKVSEKVGILNKAWGLSASIGDFNNDGWQDVYVANDYLEPDILYINNKDGTFKNEILNRFKHISFYSMGSDFADINNDMQPDLIVLDMSAEDHSRGKENMATMSTSNFNAMVEVGYHHQYMSNVLQLNNGNGSFSDIAQLAGIAKTDWSWAPLIADFDNDGFKDVFVTNGIEKDMGNQDFINQLAKLNAQGKSILLDSLLNMIPANKLPNYIYKNNRDLTFTKSIDAWGLDLKVNSNGAAYADLDNDGDLDLVINNENEIASIYKNNATNNYINIKLVGNKNNTLAIGTKVKLFTKKTKQLQELYLNRGFQSSVSNVLNFGLNTEDVVEKILVEWPNGKRSILNNVKANQTISINYNDAKPFEANTVVDNTLLEAINPESLNISYKHQENNFNDYSKQLLLPQKQSTQGPSMEVADVNDDKLDDFYVAGGRNQAAELYLQTANGTFQKIKTAAFETDKAYEDTKALFFDVDNDSDLDLYVTSSGYELAQNSNLLQDRLYLNDGKGNFSKSNNLPVMLTSTKAVKSFDFDADGDLDLIVGGRVIPGQYPLAPQSYLLENNNGVFTDVTDKVSPDLKHVGMINDIEITDYNGDGKKDFMVVGPWMPITVFKNNDGVFSKEKIAAFEKTEGWYQSITSADFDQDGDMDYVIGNIGGNNKYHPTIDKPLHIFSNDFDNSGSYDIALSKEYKGQLVPVRGKECSSEQTPYLNDKITSYKEFGSLNIEGVYGDQNILNSNHLIAYNFESVYVENLGDSNFKIRNLPTYAQIGPTQDMLLLDINKDGHLDILGVGNLYDTEVETVRYDASQGYVLLGDSKGTFSVLNNSGLMSNTDMRAIAPINIKGIPHLIIANNNDVLSIFKVN